MKGRIFTTSLFLPIMIGCATASEFRPLKPLNADHWLHVNVDYPARFWRKGMSGPVAVSLTANQNGRVRTCEIEETSGFDTLDQETCRILRRRARFAPSADNERAEPFRYQTNWDICAVPEPGWTHNPEVPEIVRDLRRAQAHCARR